MPKRIALYAIVSVHEGELTVRAVPDHASGVTCDALCPEVCGFGTRWYHRAITPVRRRAQIRVPCAQ